MRKIKIKTFVILVCLLLPLLMPLIQPAKADSNHIWEAAWHDYQIMGEENEPVANLSDTTTLTDDTGMFTTKIVLSVPVYQYVEHGEYEDTVNFRMCLYFDSFAEGRLVPAYTDQVIFIIEKDTDGSDLDKQKIEWWRSTVDSYSQGKGLSQNNRMESTYDNRYLWVAHAIALAVGLCSEPLDIALGLISKSF
jgi:hypothetical protein